MASFEYEAFDDQGKRQSGRVEAGTLVAAEKELLNRGLYLRDLRPAKGGALNIELGGGGKVKETDLALSARQLEAMTRAGVQFPEAVEFVARTTKLAALQEGLRGLHTDVLSGVRIADAARNYPKVFDGFFVGMLDAGEQTGSLDMVLGRVAGFYERQAEIKRQITGAMIYPVIVIILGVAMVYGMFQFIVPQFVDVVLDLDVELPAATRIVLSVSEFTQSFGWMILLGIAVIVFMVRASAKTAEGSLRAAKFMAGLPLIGVVIRQGVSATFAHSLSFALESGLTISEGLGVTKSSIENAAAKLVLDEVGVAVQEGVSLEEAIRAHGQLVFDPLLPEMVGAGEKAGELSALLGHTGTYLENSIKASTNAVLRTIEPVLIVGVGIFISLILLSLFVPLIQLTENIQNM